MTQENFDVAEDVAGKAGGKVFGGPDEGVDGYEEEGEPDDADEGGCGDVVDAEEELEWSD